MIEVPLCVREAVWDGRATTRAMLELVAQGKRKYQKRAS